MQYGNLFFSSPIRYAQGWEDHEVVEEGLNVKKNDVLACILASGDNVLNLLLLEPSKIYAFDISVEQICEVKLKLVAIKNLNHQEFIIFLGYRGKNSERLQLFNKIKDKLDGETLDFWKRHMNMVRKGIAFQGWWEKYISSWKHPIKLFYGKDYKKFVNAETKEERKEIFDKRLNRPSLHFLTKIFIGNFFSRLTLTRGPYVENLSKSHDHYKKFWENIEHFLVNVSCKNNQYHSWALTKKMPEDTKYWQPYLRKENYEKLRKNLDKIQIIRNDFFNGLKNFEENTFDGIYASDLLDWLDPKGIENTFLEIVRTAKNNSNIIIFVLNADKKIPENQMKYVNLNKELGQRLWKKERVGLYAKIISLSIKK